MVPQFCLAHKNLADVYAIEKNYKKAEEAFKRALSFCPFYQESQYKLAIVLMKEGDTKVARSELQKLIQRNRVGPYVDRSQEALKYLVKE